MLNTQFKFHPKQHSIALIQVHTLAHEMQILTFVVQKILGIAAGEECPPFLQLFLLCVPL
jgi:hypothetical protein